VSSPARFPCFPSGVALTKTGEKMESKSMELKSYTCTNCGNNVWSSEEKPVFGIGGCFAVQGHDYEFDDPKFEG